MAPHFLSFAAELHLVLQPWCNVHTAVQALFQFPGLDMRNAPLNTNYAIDVNEATSAAVLEYHDRWRYSLSTSVARLDGNFKVWGSGMVTVMGADGCILASWCGTNSLWALAKQLAALGARSTHFGQVRSSSACLEVKLCMTIACTTPQLAGNAAMQQCCRAYLCLLMSDMLSPLALAGHHCVLRGQPFHTGDVLRTCFRALGKALFMQGGMRDDGVKWDGFHAVALVRDSANSSHPCCTVGHGAVCCSSE